MPTGTLSKKSKPKTSADLGPAQANPESGSTRDSVAVGSGSTRRSAAVGHRTKPPATSTLIRAGSKGRPHVFYLDRPDVVAPFPTYAEALPDIAVNDIAIFPGDDQHPGLWKIASFYAITSRDIADARSAAIGSVEFDIKSVPESEHDITTTDSITIGPRPRTMPPGLKTEPAACSEPGPTADAPAIPEPREWKALGLKFRETAHCDGCDTDINAERIIVSAVQPANDLGLAGQTLIRLAGCQSCLTVYAVVDDVAKGRSVHVCDPGSPEQREHAAAMDKAANVRQIAPPATSGREASTTSAPSTRNSAPLPTRYGPRGNPVDDRPTDPDRFDTAA